MKVTVEFFSLPNVVKLVGGKSIGFDFPGRTIRDLIQALADRYGPNLRRFLLDESGQLDLVLSVFLNQKERIPREQLDRTLKDGDTVMIMMLVGGG